MFTADVIIEKKALKENRAKHIAEIAEKYPQTAKFIETLIPDESVFDGYFSATEAESIFWKMFDEKLGTNVADEKIQNSIFRESSH